MSELHFCIYIGKMLQKCAHINKVLHFDTGLFVNLILKKDHFSI